MNDTDINAFNLKIRQTPWYQEWFQQRGLDPNHVKLNDQQRQELKSLVEQQAGFKFPGDMKIDPAGNLNEKGGWAGLPLGVKIAIIAGATVATAGAAGAFSGGAGAASGAAGGGASTATGAGTVAAGTGAGVGTGTAATVAGTAASAPSVFSRVSNIISNPLVQAGGRMITGATQAAANNRGVEIDARLAHDRLALEDSQNARGLETDDYRKSLFGQLAAGYKPSARPAGAEGRNPEGFITPEAREAGSLMSDIARRRLEAQNYSTITPWSQLPVKPGTMERIGNYAGPALSLFDPRVYQR
jgi:hypothetical protein